MNWIKKYFLFDYEPVCFDGEIRRLGEFRNKEKRSTKSSPYIVRRYMEVELAIVKVKEITHGVVELRSDNILVFRPDVSTFKDYNLKVLADLVEVFLEITEGTPRPYLVDNRYITGIVNKEEQAFVNAHFERFATKGAMITHSPIIKVLLNSYTAVFKPKIELKLFTTEEAAVKWLLRE